jgi:hypothetical protein
MRRDDAASVDVLLPARGELPWIAATFDSLARQSAPLTTCFLIDDGMHAPERVMRIAREHLDGRVTLLQNPGSGISSALNYALQHSRSRWVARMDADDVAHPGRLQQQLAWLAAQSDATVACGTQVWLIDARGRRLQRSNYPELHEVIREQCLERSCFCHPTLLFRRDALLEVPYRPALDGAEDVDLMLRLGERWRIGNLPQALLDYRVHNGQIARGYRARQTALQELAFRLAELRAATGVDVLDGSPGLAEAFLNWRIADPGYANARQAMTGLRYLLAHLHGGSLRAAASCMHQTFEARPWQRDTRRWLRRLLGSAPGRLRHDPLPASLAALALPKAE